MPIVVEGYEVKIKLFCACLTSCVLLITGSAHADVYGSHSHFKRLVVTPKVSRARLLTSSATVPSTPDLPASETPSGGWSIEYGDAFGSQALKHGGNDNTYFPSNTVTTCDAHEGFNPTEELENFTCGQVSSTSKAGLQLKCSYGAPAGATTSGPPINYDCGATLEAYNQQPNDNYEAFTWMDPYNSGHTIVVQWEWQLPPDYQFDPAIWGTGLYTGADQTDGDEIDLNESFGWGSPETGGSWQNVPYTQPTFVDESPSTYLTYTFDPSAQMYTYDVVLNGSNDTYQSYIDGVLVSSGTFESSGPEWQTEIWSLAMRGDFPQIGDQASCDPGGAATGPGCNDPVDGFTSGSHSLLIRYVAYYENTSADNAGVMVAGCPGAVYPCTGSAGAPVSVGSLPLIAPGTTTTTAASDVRAYAEADRQQLRPAPSPLVFAP